MYDNLKSEGLPVELIGIGKDTHISGSTNWTDDNDASVCADESPFQIWTDWGASQRDLYVLDFDGSLVLHQNVSSGLPDNLENLLYSLANPLTTACILGDVYVSEGHTSGSPEDYIEIYNSGEDECSLEGFQLDDNEELDDFTFGNVIIPAGGYWVGYEDQDSSFSSGLSSSGDIIVFADSSGTSLIVTLEPSLEYDGLELSQSFNENGEGCYTNPTPGEANGDCITLENDIESIILDNFRIYQNYPNPFNPTTQIRYELHEDAYVSVKVYDVMGKVINNLIMNSQTAGYKTVRWNATNNVGESVPTGVYIYEIQVGDYSQRKKMILLK